MALRLLETLPHPQDPSRAARVYRDAEWNEYRVKFYKEGKHTGESQDYHTDDLQDAKSTARTELLRS
jgi:hypothetical protein